MRGDRIVAVGTDQEINRLAGPNTRRIDLRGKSVIPGFIDNHAHFMEEGAYWTLETRLDGIESRKQALEKLAAAGKAKGPGQWVYTLGGFSPDQFADNRKPFTREELDQALPNNPVLLQFTRVRDLLEQQGNRGHRPREDDRSCGSNATPRGVRPASWTIPATEGGCAILNAAGFLEKLKRLNIWVPKEDIFETSQMAMLKDFGRRAGLTGSGGGCRLPRTSTANGRSRAGSPDAILLLPYRERSRWRQRAHAAADGRQDHPEISPRFEYYDGDEWIDHVNWGERLVNAVPRRPSKGHEADHAAPEAFVQWGREAREVAKNGIQIQIHSTMPWKWTSRSSFKQVGLINKDIPIKERPVRWTFMHMEGVTPDQVDRMKKLNMFIAANPRGARLRRIVRSRPRRPGA